MSRRSKKNRPEKPGKASPPSGIGNVAANVAVSLYPPGKPVVWQKWCLAAAILLEIAWIVILFFLTIPV